MKIYFDGCSWTCGEELENPEEERFSKLLCDELGAEETNLSIRGGSNDRIVRNLLVENNIEDYDLAVIQMTLPVRTEYYDNKWIRVNPKYNFSKWLHGENVNIKRLGEKFTRHKDFWKYYYMHVSNQKYFETKENIHFQTIRNHCKVKGVPWILCSINRWSKLDFDFMLDTKGLKVHHYGHPTKESHQKISKMMLEKIRSTR
tara:strand:+ start:277 stop:882 length:606 start_codon:yes stop_codon:yes gene_type:complete